MNLKYEYDKNPGANDNDLPMLSPWWLLAFILAAVYIIATCFLWGYQDEQSAHRERIIQAHLEALQNPPKYSLPEHYYEMIGEKK